MSNNFHIINISCEITVCCIKTKIIRLTTSNGKVKTVKIKQTYRKFNGRNYKK